MGIFKAMDEVYRTMMFYSYPSAWLTSMLLVPLQFHPVGSLPSISAIGLNFRARVSNAEFNC